MQDQLARYSPVATIAMLVAFTGHTAQAQGAPSLVALHGSMATSSDITDKFTFHVPSPTNNLTICVPIPSPSPKVSAPAPLAETEQVGSVTVTENKLPTAVTEQRDSGGNLYKVLTYQHVSPGIISVDAVMSDVRLDDNLDSPLPDATLPLPWIPPSVQRYLSSTDLVQSDDDRIVLLAQRITAKSGSEADAAQAISMWMQRNISYAMTPDTESSTDAVSTMASGQGICEGMAHLFLALARASGIPARYVAGYYIGGDITYPLTTNSRSSVQVITPSASHAWVEVWYPGAGWVPYDPQTSAGFVDTHHMPVWTGLDGNSNLPILTWQSSNFSTTNCSFAEQETTTKTSDNMQVYSDGNVKSASSGTDYLFSR